MTRAAPFAAVALSAALVVLGQQTAVALGDKVEAGSCAIANSGVASGNTITCNFDMPPEKLKELIEAALKGGEEPILDRLEQVSETLGVTKSAAKNLLKIVGGDSTIPDDKLAEALSKVAGDYKRLQAQVAALNPDNSAAKALVDEAKPEIEAGHFQRAHDLLRKATQAQIAAAQEARKLREQAQAAEDAQMLGAARSTAAEGDVALTERRYTEAADLFGQAAGYVPESNSGDRGGYLLRQADALSQQGYERGDNAALHRAIAVYGRALVEYPRSQFPLDWAATQNNLGNALKRLGNWESGTTNLNAAVAAFRAALEERTRDRVPLDWAMTQNNLGNALRGLGERESGTATLEAAVVAYRAALEEQTRDLVPLDWAMTQNNLGNALRTLGERESGTTTLEAAVVAFRAALEERTRDRVPLLWAMTQNNLGTALRSLGERESGTTTLEAAVAAFRAALEEQTRDRVPFDWAATQMNLGTALKSLGERESGTTTLEASVAAYRAALEEQTRDRVPLKWAESFGNQGVAMMVIADRTNDAVLAEVSVRQIETAYEASQSGGQKLVAAYFHEQLPKAQQIRDRLKGSGGGASVARDVKKP
jgi:tetratricopeptide (TPR) repeat protein